MPLTHMDYIEVIITTIAELPGLVVSALFIDKLGRKRMMMLLFFTCAVATFLLLIYNPVMRTIELFVGRASIVGAFLVLYTYTPEVGIDVAYQLETLVTNKYDLFNSIGLVISSRFSLGPRRQVYGTSIRATAFGVCVSVSRIGGMIAPLVGQVLVDHGKAQISFIVFGAVVLTGVVFSYALPVRIKAIPHWQKPLPSLSKLSTDYWRGESLLSAMHQTHTNQKVETSGAALSNAET